MQFKTNTDLVSYPDALEYMERYIAAMHAKQAAELVWLLEHPPLYTAGTSANDEDLLVPDRFDVYKTGRGGEYTYHGPGQQIAYVMLNLNQRKPDIRAYIYNLEQWIINSVAVCGVEGQRRAGRVGIWVEKEGKDYKIAAIGVRVRRWITFHGIALNRAPNLEHFSSIVPCGIAEYGVTSLADMGVDITRNALHDILQQEWNGVFGES